MLPAIRELETLGDWDTMRAGLGQKLGLSEPVPSPVLARAQKDDKFASYLLRSVGHHRLLDQLLHARENEDYVEQISPVAPQERSNLDIMAKLGKSGLDWAKTGFQTLDRDVIDARLAACARCPNLTDPPDKLVYKVALVSRSRQDVCGACGCFVSRKAALPSESCPVADPDNPNLTRWGDPIAETVG